MSYQDLWYQSKDGLRLYARDYPKDDAGLTVLCMHGLTRNSADFADLAASLQSDYRVIAVDQRGRGRSEWDSNPANYNTGLYVDDMFTLIDHLRLTDVVLIGTSMGGLMSMIMTTMKPDQFRGVVLNDIGPVVSTRGLDRIKGYVGKGKPVETWEEAIEQTATANSIAFPGYQRENWAKWVERMYEENEDGKLSLRYDPAISQPLNEDDTSAVPADLWPMFEAISKLPLLLVRGALSDILEPDCVAEMQRRHPQMQFFEVADVGHAPMLDEAGVVPAMKAFLSGIR